MAVTLRFLPTTSGGEQTAVPTFQVRRCAEVLGHRTGEANLGPSPEAGGLASRPPPGRGPPQFPCPFAHEAAMSTPCIYFQEGLSLSSGCVCEYCVPPIQVLKCQHFMGGH